MKIQSELPEDMDSVMKARSLQELAEIINGEIKALTIKDTGDI